MQLESSINSLPNNLPLYKASEESSEIKLGSVTAESTRLGQLFEDVCAEAAEIQERLGAMDAANRFIVDDS